MKKVLIINGMGGAGKDTFVDFLKEIIPTLHISIVDNIKQLAKQLGWDEKKDEKGRRFLSDLKVAIDNYDDGNYKYVENIVRKFYNNQLDAPYELLCIDMREGHQIEKAKKDFKAITVFVDRNVPSISSNLADAGVYNFKYDYYIENNGTLLELKQKARQFVNTLKSTNTINQKNEADSHSMNKEDMLNKFMKLIEDFEVLFNLM